MTKVSALLGAAGVAASVAAHAEAVTLDAAQLGQAPVGFQIARTGQGAPATWAVVEDKDAAGGRALEQRSRDSTDYRFPLAIYEAGNSVNVDVQVRFKAISGRVDQAGGLAIRLTSPDDYYVVRANALENNVRFYRMVRGKREQLGGADIPVASNQWHRLGLKAERERFTISFNGRILYAVNDDTFAGAGKVALWTKADSVTRFDQLVINPLP
jgi:hypothetical protein